MADVKPFQINVPQDKLDILRKKLELTRLPDALEGVDGFAMGSPLADIKRLHRYWLDSYDWRAQERRINASLPQFTAPIDADKFGTLNIHFVHAKSKVANAIPLLFVHGWPGSFLEVSKILPLLLDAGQDGPSFHVVAPSLPGYGFSDGATRSGLGPAEIAGIFNKLMLKLGYDKYVTQGGDWGWIVTRLCGVYYPQNCRASHLNMFRARPPTLSETPLLYAKAKLFPWTAQDKAEFAWRKWFTNEGFGYFLTQSTRPQTIGYAQTDSPVGLLAWIYEKLHDWTDNYPWTEDEVLTWISMYWFATAGPIGGTRLYYEDRQAKRVDKDVLAYNPHTKLGLARFAKEIILSPKRYDGMMGPVVLQSDHKAGGHFAAWEQPAAVVGDLRAMFGRGGGAYGAVPGHDGYDNVPAARL